ncbi:MAG: type II toxin-antitoxin system Phd/YefM family antitoxin [Elusimicrobia bacterium]|nr:type II toxin-antitoxin system Phd/YefM family antitoxin [Elusimicrobiota bacterium]
MIKKEETILPATDVRKKFFKILEEVKKPNRVYTITLGGKHRAVIMSAEEYEAWRETIEIATNPEIVKDLKEAEKDFKAGRYTPLEEVLKEEGYIVREAPKKKYVPRSYKR